MKGPPVAWRYKAAHLLWPRVWLLAIPAGIVTVFVVGWAPPGLAVIAAGFFLRGALKKSYTEFVLEQALREKEFYDFGVNAGLIMVGVHPEMARRQADYAAQQRGEKAGSGCLVTVAAVLFLVFVTLIGMFYGLVPY